MHDGGNLGDDYAICAIDTLIHKHRHSSMCCGSRDDLDCPTTVVRYPTGNIAGYQLEYGLIEEYYIE